MWISLQNTMNFNYFLFLAVHTKWGFLASDYKVRLMCVWTNKLWVRYTKMHPLFDFSCWWSLRLNLLKHEKKCHLWKNKSQLAIKSIFFFIYILCIRIFFILSVRRSLGRCSIGKNIRNGGFYNIIFCTVFPFKNTHYGIGGVFIQIEFCKWRLYLCVCAPYKKK